MQSFSSHVSVQTEGTQNILVIELQEGQQLIPYCCKVMENNNIPGLLPMRHQMMDGTIRLRYNIGGKVPLHEYLRQHHHSRQNSLLLLRNLSSALLHLQEYFLSTDMCYLDPEHIYVGDGLHSYLACVPVRQEGAQNGLTLKRFYEKLLSDYFASGNDQEFVEMFMWVYRSTLFDLETFYRQFLQEKAEPAAVPEKPAAPAPAPAAPSFLPPDPPAAPEPPKEGILQKAAKGIKSIEKPAPPAEPAAPLPFAVPGAPAGPDKAPQPPAPPAPPESPAKAKPAGGKGFLSFSKHGKKEKEQTASFPVPSKPEPAPTPAPPATPPIPPAPKPKKEKAPAPVRPPKKAEEWSDDSIFINGSKPAPDPDSETDIAPAPVGGGAPTGAWFLHNGQKVAITETPFLVGKYNTACHLHYAIYDNNKVSRSHATFLFEKGHYLIRDNQSRNGTFLNGQALLPLQPAKLKDGDEIKLYDEVLIFHQG